MSRPIFATLSLALSILVACAAPDETCKTNDTRACLCPGGDSSSQTCKNGTWGECACANPGGPDAHPGGPDAPVATKHHGDICTAPAFDCGAGTNLVCVVDQQGDTQGVCRFACGSFSDCLNNSEAHAKFDNDCCDIGNGTSVCGMSSQWPQGACH